MKTNNDKKGIIMKTLLLLLSISAFTPFALQAKEVAGINIAENITLSGSSNTLVLNGAGIRTKFIFDIYIGSLYLEKKQSSAKDIYSASGEKSIGMHFLYDEVSKEKLVSGWNDGFEGNNSEDELAKLKARIDQFNALFVTVKKGDIINLNYTPANGTQVVINGSSKGSIKGNDFFTAVLKIWLGEEPADDDLKNSMLGKKDE